MQAARKAARRTEPDARALGEVCKLKSNNDPIRQRALSLSDRPGGAKEHLPVPPMPPTIARRRGCDRGGTCMKIDTDDFRVRAGDKVKLHKWPTRVAPVYKSKAAYQDILRVHVERLSALQSKLYAA